MPVAAAASNSLMLAKQSKKSGKVKWFKRAFCLFIYFVKFDYLILSRSRFMIKIVVKKLFNQLNQKYQHHYWFINFSFLKNVKEAVFKNYGLSPQDKEIWL